jgi:hypothetical protein
MKTIQDIVRAAQELIDAVSFDDSGIDGRGGNGGLISRETIRKSDELRILLSRLEREADEASACRVYLDLDGVMADFDAHFPATFGLDHRGLADDDMWSTINGHPSYFRDMPPCAGAVEFFRSIEHLEPIVLTACPKSNYPHVAGQKRDWVREHLSLTATILPVMGGRHKPLFMHAPGDILIDDWEKNTGAWTAAGGVAILHRDFASTASSLFALIDGGGNG